MRPSTPSPVSAWGRRDTVGAALDAGAFLAQAKGRLHHGEWGDWLHRVGLAPRTASMWMKLAGMDLTAEDVIERGGIVQTLRGRHSQIGNRCRFAR